MEGTPKDTRPRAGEFAATGGLPVRRCAFAKTKFFLRKLVFALPANPQVDVACGSACCVARSPQGGGGMRRARGSAYPSGVALEDFSKTVGRFACRGFRPPSLATDWEWGGFKTHPTSEASDRPSVRHVSGSPCIARRRHCRRLYCRKGQVQQMLRSVLNYPLVFLMFFVISFSSPLSSGESLVFWPTQGPDPGGPFCFHDGLKSSWVMMCSTDVGDPCTFFLEDEGPAWFRIRSRT